MVFYLEQVQEHFLINFGLLLILISNSLIAKYSNAKNLIYNLINILLILNNNKMGKFYKRWVK